MARRFTQIMSWAAAALVAGVASCPGALSPVDEAMTLRFQQDVEQLCRAPHRLAGSAQLASAAEYVADQLRAAGVEQVILQPVMTPYSETVSTLTVEGRSVPVYALRANMWQPSISGAEAIRGRTLWAGSGSPEEYGSQNPKGRVVVLAYESARRWRDAFAMGARAVIFVETGGTPARFARYETISADLPRFFVRAADAAASGLMESGKEVTIEARAAWDSRPSYNVIGWIPGTNAVFNLESEELLVLSAQLDTFGQVPSLVQGARGAANCAALLEITRQFMEQPPARSVLVAFLGAEARSLTGASALYNAIYRQEPFLTYRRTHADFIAEHEAESAFLGEVIEALDADDVFSFQSPAGRRALELLRRWAETRASEVRALLGELRIEIVRAGETTPGNAARLAELLEEEQQWNNLRRALAKAEWDPAVADYLARTREGCREQLESRRRELVELIEVREVSRQIGALVTGKTIVLHLGVDFGDQGSRWGIGHYDNDAHLINARHNNVGLYAGVFAALSSTLAGVQSATGGPSLIEPRTLDVQVGPPLYFPQPVLNAAQMASRFGVYGLRLASCHDVLPLNGHPHDRLEAIDSGHLAALCEDAMPMVMALARTPALSLRQRIRPTAAYEEPEWTGTRLLGQNVMVRSPGSAIASEPGSGALLGLSNHSHIPGFDLAVRTLAGQNGYVATGPLHGTPPRGLPPRQWTCFLLDAGGRIHFANQRIGFDLRRVELFPCRPITLVSLVPPDLAIAETTVLNARNDGPFQSRESLAVERGPTATFFVPHTADAIKTVNSMGLLLLNATAEHPTGKGFAVGDAWRLPDTERHGAHDLLALNEYRLEILRDRRLSNDSLEWLHGLSKAALRRAGEATSTAQEYTELAMARRLQRRVYAPLRASMDDLVKAVVILMLLTIPFAHALERLLIGTPHIYRQIGWYCTFFIATFAVLYVVHPAFAIATEPIVIFLAFLIIMLSAIVIWILLSRFQAEIKALQGLPVTVHRADVSRFGTVMAAVSMGISTMRRRPLRTLLTTATVILLTFSILSFASFDAQQGILRRYVGAGAGERVVFLHNALWVHLPDQVADVVRHVAGEGAQVTERRWVAASSSGQAAGFSMLATKEHGTNSVLLSAVVGLESADLRAQPGLQACFPAPDDPDVLRPGSLYLPEALAEGLDAKVGDRILVRGHALTFAGTLDTDALTRFQQIDRSPLFPVDYNDPSLAHQQDAIEGTSAASQDAANQQSESAFLPYYNANQVGFVHSDTALEMGGRTVAVSVYPGSAAGDIRHMADRLARLVRVPVYATLADGVYRLYFTTVLAVAGTGSLLIPIILGGLIVFGTMLGSVTDREKEIYSFSALGLAPAHIGTLFFAEASVYAVVGGMGGYILAQVVAFVAGWLSNFMAFNMPEMNYSSTNAIVAILIVMATVMLSTIYPAYRGSKSANPGVVRSWRLPRAKGDAWEFLFPFTVSEYDITGIMSFLLEHFENYTDCSLGLFLSENPRIHADGHSLTLSSHVATAPFDLGVTQSFELTSVPSEIEGINEIKIAMLRQSGTQGDWRRTNRPFISDLRKQFLIWRSLPPETTEHYRRRTLERLAAEKQSNA